MQRTAERHITEATGLLDSIDRWKIAERFGIENVHSLTRSQLFGFFERASGFRGFQSVMHDMREMQDDPGAEGNSFPMINFAEFTDDQESSPGSDDCSVLTSFAHTTRWLRDVVTQVCPYVRPSLERRRIWMTTASRSESTGEQLYQMLLTAREAFRALGLPTEDAQARLNCLLVLFPDFPGNRSPVQVLRTIQSEGGFYSFNGVTAAPFSPSSIEGRMHDPLKKAPPVFAFRHEI